MQAFSALPSVRQERRLAGAQPSGRSAAGWLGGVAAAFALLQLVLVAPGIGLGWDETVYVSQVSPQAPAAFFSAPRARGVTLLAAPVTGFTDSLTALRVHLALLSGCALFLSLWVWRRLVPPPVLALAGGLFATLWITLFYGPQVMPNLWVAFAAFAATGLFLRALRLPPRLSLAHLLPDRDPGPRILTGLGLSVAFTALMRPLDAAFLVLPLAVVALAARPRRPGLLLVLFGGAAVGCADWIAEAHVRFGGLFTRLDRSSEIQGRLGWHPSFDDHARALAGRALCRPCDVPWDNPATAVWWFVLPVLTVLGLLTAARRGRGAPSLLAVGTAVSLAVPYLLMTDYAAPRFLLPAYLLLAVPVAEWLAAAPRALRPGRRPAAVAALAVLLAGHLAIQYRTLAGAVDRSSGDRDAYLAVASVLRREGIRPPCVLTGAHAVRLAYHVGCASRLPTGHDASISQAGLEALAADRPTALLAYGTQQIPPYARGWRLRPLPPFGQMPAFRAYLSPPTRP